MKSENQQEDGIKIMKSIASLQNTAKSQLLGKPAQTRLLLQRKCACGGSPGLSRECESAMKREKRMYNLFMRI
jgi:hypothetical protein